MTGARTNRPNAPRLARMRRHSAAALSAIPPGRRLDLRWLNLGWTAIQAGMNRVESIECKQEIRHCETGEGGEGSGRSADGQAARCLVEQDRFVPSQRQQGPVDLRERVHAEGRKSHAGEAERRRDDQAGDAQSGQQVARQQLQQRAQRQIADDKEPCCCNDHGHITSEFESEPSLHDQRHSQHHQREDDEQGHELSGDGNDWVAASARQPGAHASPSELGTHRVTRAHSNHDVQHSR